MGRVRKVASRIYASVPELEVESAIRASWAEIVAQLYPDTVISYHIAPLSIAFLTLTESSSSRRKELEPYRTEH